MRESYQSFHVLRGISAASITYFHTMPTDNEFRKYGYTGLIIFLLISSTLSFCKESIHLNFVQYAKKKGQRVIVPFLFWSLFYFFVSVYAQGFSVASENLSLESLFSGTHYHLWFLPYIYITYIFSFLLYKINFGKILLESSPKYSYLLGLFAFSVQIFVVAWIDLGDPWIQYITSTPCLFLGLFVARKMKLDRGRRLISIYAPTLIALAALMILIEIESEKISMYSLAYGIGFLIFCMSFYWPSFPARDQIKRFSDLTLGIYLIHPFIILVFYKLFPFMNSELSFLPILFISAIVTYALRLFPLVKLFV